MRKLIPLAFLILLLLLFSQGVWLYRFIQKEKTAYHSSLQKELVQIANFHAMEHYGEVDRQHPDKRFLTIEDASQDTTMKENDAIAVYHLDTKNYKRDKDKFLNDVFIDLALFQKKFNLRKVDTLFQKNFANFEQITNYTMYLKEKGKIIDSLSYKNWNTKNTLLITIPLGTKGAYAFEGSFKLKKSAFVQHLIGSVGISAVAIVLVALFIGWQLIALQRSKQKLEWKQRVVAGIVHDLKSPLAHVYTVLDFFTQTEQNENKKKQLSVAGSRVKTLSEKIAKTLSIFKAQNSSIILQTAPYVLHQRCLSLLEELNKIYQNKEITTNLSIPENLQLRVDEFYFDSVLRNLIENAIKYSPENVLLNISTQITAKKLYIHIADKGNGIAPNQQKKIFKEYYRSKNITSKGHGIGLSFTKLIVQKHKGSISLQSELGKGSRFTLCFPKVIVI